MKMQFSDFISGGTKRPGRALLAAVILAVGISGTLSACGKPAPADLAGSGSGSASAQAEVLPNGSSQADTLGFADLIGFLGKTEAEVTAALGETPVGVDEGGMAYDKTGIRIWFDEETHTKVAQVLILTDAFDLNGVKLGDSFSDFKKVFGEPISDKNGDAHFQYDGVYLSVVRDPSAADSEKTIAVYILQEDF